MSIKDDRLTIEAAARSIIAQIFERPVVTRRDDIRRGPLRWPPLTVFQDLEPIGFGIEEDKSFTNPVICTPDVVWPLQAGWIIDPALADPACFDAAPGDRPCLNMNLVRTITPAEVRGTARRFSRYMVREDSAVQGEDGWHTAAMLHAWIGGRWVDAAYCDSSTVYLPNERYGPAFGTSIAFAQRYQWAVSLGLAKQPSVRFRTDPTGMKAIFAIRDLPEGRDRRAALMTWISDHWRQDRTDPEVEIYIRKHLRGATRFSWQGMEAAVLPAPFDIETAEKLKVEREAMRGSGSDRRRR